MGYFAGQSLLVIAAAFALGLLVGRLVWGRGESGPTGDSDAVRRLRREHEAAMRWMRMEHFDTVQAVRDDLERVRHEVETLRVGPAGRSIAGVASSYPSLVVAAPAPAQQPAQPVAQPVAQTVAQPPAQRPEPDQSVEPVEADGQTVLPLVDLTEAGVDDLQRVEGIGPKMAAALHDSGIHTFADLATTSYETLREATARHGLRFSPSMITWPDQARLLADGDDEGFARLTASLVSGRAPSGRP